MKFEIKELEDKNLNYAVVDLSKDCIKNLKENLKSCEAIKIDFAALNLDKKLYGSNKKESIEIQRENCKQIVKLYKRCKRVVAILKRKKFNFGGTFFVENLEQKKNNNDFMLCAMLETRFNTFVFNRLAQSIIFACDYLDKENGMNNMCDFKDNQCVCHREKGKKGTTGCCPSFCKFTKSGVCKIKNLSCKIFMCDFLEERGYYFSPHGVPIMKVHMSVFERLASFGMLCRTTKKTIVQMWLIRLLTALYVALFAFVLCIIIF